MTDLGKQLIEAAGAGPLVEVNRLLENGADANYKDPVRIICTLIGRFIDFLRYRNSIDSCMYSGAKTLLRTPDR